MKRAVDSAPPPNTTQIAELQFKPDAGTVVILRTYELDEPELANPFIGRAQVSHMTEAFFMPENREKPGLRAGARCSTKDSFDLRKGEVIALTRVLDYISKMSKSEVTKQMRTELWAKYHRARKVDDEKLFLKTLIHSGFMTPQDALQELAEFRADCGSKN